MKIRAVSIAAKNVDIRGDSSAEQKVSTETNRYAITPAAAQPEQILARSLDLGRATSILQIHSDGVAAA